MIIISETPKADVIVAIDKEMGHVRGLLDTIQLLKDTPENYTLVESVINKNAVMKGVENDLRKTLNSRPDLLPAIEFSLKQLDTWLPKLKDRIIKSNTKIYDQETITFKEKGILDTVSSVNFFTRYAGMVFNIALTLANKEANISSLLSKADWSFFNNTAKYFSILIVRFSQSIKELEEGIEDLSDETYDTMSEDILRGTVGDKAVTALRGLMPHELNPLYWWRLLKMKKDIKLIIDANEQMDMLAMKIARLNNRRSGVEDPEIDRQIEIYEDELLKRQGKIAQIEARYGN